MMRGWVGPQAVAAVPYNVPCANGHRLRGDRTEGYQALRCPSCGEAVFILPRSPLPEPPIPAATKRTRSGQEVVASYPSDDAPHSLVDPPAWSESQAALGAGGASSGAHVADTEIDWEEAPKPNAPQPQAAPLASPQTQPAPAPRPRPKGTPGPRPQVARPGPAASVAPPAEREAAPRLTWREWASRHRNPLLAAGLILLIVGAVLIKQRRNRLESLPRIAELGRTEGIKRLDAGDFFAAKKILAEAASAVDALGDRIEGADAIRQAAREAAIMTDLVPRSLEDLVEEAATYSDVAGWTQHFNAMYRGRSILLETTISATPDPAKPGSRYEDAYRILVGRNLKSRRDRPDRLHRF